MALGRAAKSGFGLPYFTCGFLKTEMPIPGPLGRHGAPLRFGSRLNLLSLLEDLMKHTGAFRLDFLGDGRDEEA
jgi:hypothetical protein